MQPAGSRSVMGENGGVETRMVGGAVSGVAGCLGGCVGARGGLLRRHGDVSILSYLLSDHFVMRVGYKIAGG